MSISEGYNGKHNRWLAQIFTQINNVNQAQASRLFDEVDARISQIIADTKSACKDFVEDDVMVHIERSTLDKIYRAIDNTEVTG